jgi:hypothetical protein
MINSKDSEMKELGFVMLKDFIKSKSMHRRLRRYISTLSLPGRKKKELKTCSVQKSLEKWQNGKDLIKD